ncbi:MAG TPA: hypothetical protein VLR90_13405 [Blastocatellia bacterium]|nr:hypothetical protein [Blastocatellia bacterium]
MAKSKKTNRKTEARKASSPVWRRREVLIAALVAFIASVVAVTLIAKKNDGDTQPAKSIAANTNTAPAPPPTQSTASPPNEAGKEPQTLSMDVNTAVMVTEELDFGGRPPGIAEALKQIERRYKPDDGQGRTFAVLDAYGEPTPDGKLLHISMHVSSEKPGMGELIFKRTGKVLWRSRINPTTLLPKQKTLTIIMDDGTGKTYTVDGTGKPPSIFESKFMNGGVPVANLWPDGAEREITFIYSACGCPVKVMVKRVGNRTVRAKDLPVIFPDDPEAVALIQSYMKW